MNRKEFLQATITKKTAFVWIFSSQWFGKSQIFLLSKHNIRLSIGNGIRKAPTSITEMTRILSLQTIKNSHCTTIPLERMLVILLDFYEETWEVLILNIMCIHKKLQSEFSLSERICSHYRKITSYVDWSVVSTYLNLNSRHVR